MLILGVLSKCNGEISVHRGSHRNRWTACGPHASSLHPTPAWRLPKIRGTISGVSKIRITVYWGSYWGPPIHGNYQIIQPQSLNAAPNPTMHKHQLAAGPSL